MLQQFQLMSEQIGGGAKQSSAARAQEIIREIADAVVDPEGNAALPERIIANYERLGLGNMGGTQMRNFLLQNPDAGEFLRDMAVHANARIPDGTLAAVTDPESVNPETLLNTALQVPINPPPNFAQTPEQASAAAIQLHIASMMENNTILPIGKDVDPDQAQAGFAAAQRAAATAGPPSDIDSAYGTASSLSSRAPRSVIGLSSTASGGIIDLGDPDDDALAPRRTRTRGDRKAESDEAEAFQDRQDLQRQRRGGRILAGEYVSDPDPAGAAGVLQPEVGVRSLMPDPGFIANAAEYAERLRAFEAQREGEDPDDEER